MLPNGRFENLNNVVPKGWKSSTVEALKESSKVGLIEINVSSVHNFDGCTLSVLLISFGICTDIVMSSQAYLY